MPWIHAPFFVLVRKQKNADWIAENMEVVDALAGHEHVVIEHFLECQKVRNATELVAYDYRICRLIDSSYPAS